MKNKMSKLLSLLGLVVVASILFNTGVYADSKIDTSNAKKGYVTVTYDGNFEKTILVQVVHVSTKGSDNFYLSNNKATNVPLSRGDGDYEIILLEQVSQTQARKIINAKVKAKIEDPNARFLVPNAFTVYEANMEFLKGYATTYEKIEAINDKLAKFYDDVVRNVVYDKDKANLIVTKKISYYVPIIDTTYKTKKGICSDYATLVAGYLRSLGIPTKVVQGHNPEIGEFHAWNEIFVDGKWLIVDATWDAAYVQAGHEYTMAKDWKNLTVSRVY